MPKIFEKEQCGGTCPTRYQNIGGVGGETTLIKKMLC